jgi:membrane associated rhomboid family serine protease
LRQPDDQAPAGPFPAPPPAPATCYRHPDRVTGLRCSRCGRPICGECAQPAPVGQLCPDDARDQVRNRVRDLPGAGGAPVVTWALLGLNALLLLVEVAMTGNGGAGLLEPSSAALCRLGALNSAAIAESGQYWRLFTVMVLHAGVLHFLLNSYALYLFGPVLEQVLGRVRFLVLYVGAGFVGSGASFALGHTELGVGASGAIFGLLGALAVYFFRRRGRGGQAPFQQIVFLVLFNLLLASQIARIDNTAHLGGFIGGLAGMALFDALPARRSVLRALGLAAPFALGAALVAVGVTTYAPGSGLSCVGV